MTTKSRWMFTICSIAGVPIRIHGTFLLFVAWIVFISSDTLHDALWILAFVTSIFTCVLLHECGHVFCARLFGISTRDIVLYPFGGIALLTAQPRPKAELVIAIAGPVVNFILAAALYLFSPEVRSSALDFLNITGSSFLLEVFRANIFIGLFNLIPAIPMDGGRILRALLAIFKVKKATNISARISQGCSIVMGIIGIATGSIMLMVISGIVFMGAMQEIITDETQNSAEGKVAKDFMVEKEKLFCFSHGTTLQDSIRTAIKSSQEFFPVMYGQSLLGTIDRDDIISSATNSDESNEYLSGIMQREPLTFDSSTSIKTVLDSANTQGAHVVAIEEDGTFCGLLFVNRVSELLVIDTIRLERQKFEEDHDSSNFTGF